MVRRISGGCDKGRESIQIRNQRYRNGVSSKHSGLATKCGEMPSERDGMNEDAQLWDKAATVPDWRDESLVLKKAPPEVRNRLA